MIETLENVQEFYKYERMRSFDNDDFAITFQVTGECNFRCSYCYERKCPERMDEKTAKALIDKLFPIEDNILWWNGYLRGASEKNSILFDFFGGECTLEIDLMESLCQYFMDKCDEDPERYKIRKEKFNILIETNGSLLRTPKVEAFLRKWEKHINLGISLDGNKVFHDSCRVFKDGSPTWEVVKDNILWVLHTFPKLKITKIKSTATSQSLPYFYESYLFFKKMGLSQVDMTIALGCKWTEDDERVAKEQFQLILDDMLNDPHPVLFNAFETGEAFCNLELLSRGQLGTCGTAGNSIALSSDNKLYTCHQFSHITMFNRQNSGIDFCIGSVNGGITDHGMEIVNMILNSYNKKIFSEEKCKRCIMRPGCEYCPAFAFKNSGDINVMEDERCRIERIRMAYGMKYKYEMEKKRWQRENFR